MALEDPDTRFAVVGTRAFNFAFAFWIGITISAAFGDPGSMQTDTASGPPPPVYPEGWVTRSTPLDAPAKIYAPAKARPPVRRTKTVANTRRAAENQRPGSTRPGVRSIDAAPDG